ncbi:unnamed protein product [Acanthoscelides obtectus]|uniref:Reverse transcriptase domain-containing protein n=1 Tax=Acanthoscelides obtectus TaxID=200917 RepID=A0A9P0P2G5_ACAOB|nr:unnamed protein product [Acanthoscelides obtectus]CAK1669696.1 Transposon Ty3-I Gag-Pol polyprotein [Acanthoscelides obtectus]
MAGVIQKEKACYISPLVCVRKKDGRIRVCLDARGLNAKVKKDFINPPNPTVLLVQFKQGQLMSTVDLTKAYWQIAVFPDHTKYLGFMYEGETYTFRRLPFGLSMSMKSLIRCLNGILERCNDFAQAYVDDLFIYSNNIGEHLKHWRIIIERFLDARITVKLRKFVKRFCRAEGSFQNFEE